jgi:hypothetical protein
MTEGIDPPEPRRSTRTTHRTTHPQRYRAADDGRIYRGRTPEELIDQLRRLSMAPQPTRQGFMVEMAVRHKRWNGETLDTSSPAAFIASLVAQGFLTAC